MSENVDYRLLSSRLAKQDERARLGGGNLEGGGLPPYDGGMEARVARLETDVSEIKSILGRLAPRIDEMYGRLQHMPTLWQIATVMLAINTGIVAVAALGLHLFR